RMFQICDGRGRVREWLEFVYGHTKDDFLQPRARFEAEGGFDARTGFFDDGDVEADAAVVGQPISLCHFGREVWGEVLVPKMDAPSSQRLFIGNSLHNDLLAVDVAAFVMALEKEDTIDGVIRNKNGK